MPACRRSLARASAYVQSVNTPRFDAFCARTFLFRYRAMVPSIVQYITTGSPLSLLVKIPIDHRRGVAFFWAFVFFDITPPCEVLGLVKRERGSVAVKNLLRPLLD